MKKYITFFVALIAFLVSTILSCKSPSSATVINATLQGEGTLVASGVTLKYFYSMPDREALQENMPLILALHYGGTVTATIGKDFLDGLVEPALKDLNAFIVSPNCPNNQGWTVPATVNALLALVDHVSSSYSIDVNKILVVGYSMGGFGTWHMAANHSNVFSAAIPMAATPINADVQLLGNVPVYAIIGSEDEVVSAQELENLVEDFQNQWKNVELHVVDGLTHYEVSRYVQPLSQSVPWIQSNWD